MKILLLLVLVLLSLYWYVKLFCKTVYRILFCSPVNPLITIKNIFIGDIFYVIFILFSSITAIICLLSKRPLFTPFYILGFTFLLYTFFKARAVTENPTAKSLLKQFDTISDGIEFEKCCASILEVLNFTDVQVTKSSGDFGVDITAAKDGVKYAVQCKRYSSPIGNSAVQEAVAGTQYYHCDQGVVMTNSCFTSSAIELASATNVQLWNGDYIKSLLKQCKYGTPSANIDSKHVKHKDTPQTAIKDATVSQPKPFDNDSMGRKAHQSLTLTNLIDLAFKCGHLTVPLVCAVFDVGDGDALHAIHDLVDLGIVAQQGDSPLFQTIVSPEEFARGIK